MTAEFALKLPIDLTTADYRRAFERALDPRTGAAWTRIEGDRVVCLNGRTVRDLPDGLPPGKQIFHWGVESDEEIRGLAQRHEGRAVTYVARIGRDNLYRFGTATLDRARVLFVLDYVPRTLEERFHAFNLFHKALMLRRNGFALFYQHRVVELLTSVGELPAEPPGLVESLGAKSIAYQLRVFRERVWNRLDLWHRLSRIRARWDTLGRRRTPKKLDDCRDVLVTGWYGTETAGDKAILLEVVHALRENHPDTRLSITSIVPGLSRLTNLETGLDAEVLELRSLSYRRLKTVDLVVFGGGPLMDSSQLKYIATLFEWARRRGVATLVFGCGVGPLRTEAGTERVGTILRAAGHGFFRDERSAAKALELGFAGPGLHACDPALRYVHRWKLENPEGGHPPAGERLVALLRAQTSEYSPTAGADSDDLTRAFAGFVQAFQERRPAAAVEMLPMHTFWFGNDDRDYAESVPLPPEAESRVTRERKTLTLNMLLRRISGARWGLPMRYHGHVFLLGLEIPFVSLDYTGGQGKVRNLVERYGLGDYSLDTGGQITAEALMQRWSAVEERYDVLHRQIASRLAADLRQLETVYRQLWPGRAKRGWEP